jgi:hypothetical protein
MLEMLEKVEITPVVAPAAFPLQSSLDMALF